ncbi:hypothetical protein NE626_16690, partial [Intestinimonas massiliensis]
AGHRNTSSLLYRAISHRTTAAATAALRDSQRVRMGIFKVLPLLHIHGDVAHRLHRVNVEQHPGGPGNGSDLGPIPS